MSEEPDVIKAIHKHNALEVRAVIKNYELYNPGRLENLFGQKSKKMGENPFIMAVKSNNAAIVETLLGTGVDMINTVSVQDQKSALMYAVSAGNINYKLIGLLLDYKIDVDAQDSFGNTALMYASQRGDLKTIEVLLEADADIKIKNENGEDAIGIAWNTGNEELCKLLDPADFLASKIAKLSLKPQMKFDVIFTKSDLEEFKQCSTGQEMSAFIGKYKENHREEGVNSKEVVYGLALKASIVLKEGDFVTHLTKRIIGDEELSGSISYILRFFDGTNLSVVSATLSSHNEEIRDLIASFIKNAVDKNLLIKSSEILPDEISHFLSALDNPIFDHYSPAQCYRDFIIPIYDEECAIPPVIKDTVASLGEV